MSITLVHVTSSLMRGGAEKVLYLLIKELQARDVKQVVFYFHPGPYIAEIERLGIKTHQIIGWWWRYDPIFFFRLYRALRQQKPTLIHSLLWAANVSARICACLQRVPVISVYHNNIDQDGFVRSFLDRLTWRCASRMIAVSSQVKTSLKVLGCAESVTVIPNGIDIHEFDAHVPITRQQLAIADDTFVIGAVGRLVPVKRFEYLINMLALWHGANAHVVIIGQGPLEHELKELVCQAHLTAKVSFIADVALPYYAVFDCFVQPSYKEGVSLALLEAMSCAKPCIVMGNGYHPVIRHEYDGMVIDPDDRQGLLKALETLYADKRYGYQLGQSARATVQERFDVKIMGARYYQVIRSLV